MSADGKHCVKADRIRSKYNLTGGTEVSVDTEPDLLPVFIDNKTVSYELVYETQFNCARHEVVLIRDDNFLSDGDRVVVWDDKGDNLTLPRHEVCVDSVTVPPQDRALLGADRLFIALLCPSWASCRGVPCLYKCCPESQQVVVTEGREGPQVDCIPASDNPWLEKLFGNVTLGHYFVLHAFPKCSNKAYLDYPDQLIELHPHGHLKHRMVTIPRSEYCADFSARGPVLLGCRQVPPGAKSTLYGSLFCLGAVFLAVTIALHLWLPELRKTLHSRILIAHVTCLFFGYVGMAVVDLVLAAEPPSTECSVTAFIIQFSFLATIFWLNIMCVDIAWTFSGLRAPKGTTALDSDGHKFLYYSLYAWGSTAAVSGVTAFLEYSPVIPATSRLKPNFGLTKCWFQHWESNLLLFSGPMGLLLLINIVLFVYTACKIQNTQRDTANLVQHGGKKLRENKDRFVLYLKLFGLMGVTWVFEVVSWLVGGSESYWYVIDVINALRSIFIFTLFCLKKKVFILIKAKFSKKNKPKFPMHPRKFTTSSKMSSSMTSQRTNSIQLSQIS